MFVGIVLDLLTIDKQKYSSKPLSKIWIAQPYKDLSTLEFSASNTVRVLHSGHVFWKQFRRFALSCDMQIDAYPFTAQNCPIKFASVGTFINLKYKIGKSNQFQNFVDARN